MTTWELCLKSHCEYPDYEDTCKARTKQQACTIFLQRLNKHAESGYTGRDIWQYIGELD